MNPIQLYQRDQTRHQIALHHANYYTPEQLHSTYAWSTIGFYCAAVASWFLMSFFIGQFFAGDDFENLSDWKPIQYVYALMGIGVATAIVVAETVLFRSGRVREYIALAVLALGFTIFAEVSATMQREQTAVSHRSTQSEVFKATVSAANQLATSALPSATQEGLSRALTALDDAKRSGNTRDIATIQNRVNQLQYQADMERQNQQALLSTTLDRARAYEYDETKHQAIIRFLAEVFGWSHVVASALFAFFTILTFKACFHYLGHTRSTHQRALAISDGSINADFMTVSTVWDSENSENSEKTASTLPYSNQQLSTVSAVHVQLETALLDQFEKDLKAGRVGVTIRDLKDWISKHTPQQLALYGLQEVADELLKQAERRGVVRKNPAHQEGNRKPKYLINRS